MNKILEEKLYWNDPELFEFQAEIIDLQDINHEHLAIILNRTAFYPESGGQPWDLGFIEDVPVLKVLENDGTILHVVSKEHEILEKGEVTCIVHEGRRRDHMQQHTGQHILSQCFLRLLDAMTLSFHLGAEYSTIDVSAADLSSEEVATVENFANKIVIENLSVTTNLVEYSEIGKYRLRKPPPARELIRVVSIGEFEQSACGGTHVKRTGNVGLIKILKNEKYKGNMRIYFCCGDRALFDYRKKQTVLHDAAMMLTCGWELVPECIQKLINEQTKLLKQMKTVREELLPGEAVALLKDADHVNGFKLVHKVYHDRNRSEIQKLAGMIAKTKKTIIILVSADQGKTHTIFASGTNVKLDMREYLNIFLRTIDGKGGGKPEFAQGGGPECANLRDLIEDIMDRIKTDLQE